MKIKNTVYTITPPDIVMPTLGPSVLMLGMLMEDSKPYIDVYDKLFPEVEITFYVSEKGYSPDNSAWYRAMTGMVSSVFINIDNAVVDEVFLAMQAEKNDHVMVFWVSEKNPNSSFLSLLNSYQYRVFNNLEEIEKYLVAEYTKMS